MTEGRRNVAGRSALAWLSALAVATRLPVAGEQRQWGATPAALTKLPGDQRIHDLVPHQQHAFIGLGQLDQPIGRCAGTPGGFADVLGMAGEAEKPGGAKRQAPEARRPQRQAPIGIDRKSVVSGKSVSVSVDLGGRRNIKK